MTDGRLMGLRKGAVLIACAAGLAIAALAAAACSQEAQQPVLDGTSWTLSDWAESTSIPADVTITAEFTGITLSGNSGVNSYSGEYEADETGAFSAGPFAGTMMAGPQAAMDAEAAYLHRLEAAKSYAVTGGTLVLKDGDGNDSLTFASSD